MHARCASPARFLIHFCYCFDGWRRTCRALRTQFPVKTLFLLPCIALFMPAPARAENPSAAGTEPAPAFQASAWEVADRLFRGDPRWVGGDGAYSIDLGGGRFLWLFGDSIIDPSGTHSRKSAGVKMISNSIGIQTGADPRTAAMHFHWKTNPDGTPCAFFPDSSGSRFWPGHGIRLRDRLLLFLMKVRTVPDGLGFEVHDWAAVLVQNPDAGPADWKVSWLKTPSNKLHVIAGSAGVLADEGFVYAYGSREPGGQDVYLVRWPEDDVSQGDLSRMAWWDGHAWSETEPSENNSSAPVLHQAGTEFTVHRNPRTGKYVQIQCAGFGPAILTMREAARLTGPWSPPITLYRPPECDKPRIMIYQGKAHPGLTGSDLVLTYSTNSFDFKNLIDDASIYYPRFVRLSAQDPAASAHPSMEPAATPPEN